MDWLPILPQKTRSSFDLYAMLTCHCYMLSTSMKAQKLLAPEARLTTLAQWRVGKPTITTISQQITSAASKDCHRSLDCAIQ